MINIDSSDNIVTFFREIPRGEHCVQYNQISFQMAIVAPFKTLKMLFGEPIDPSKISYNSRYEWNVRDVDSGICVSIFEWISKGIMPEKYPLDADVRNAPEYKWNIGAANMSDASTFVAWLMNRDPSVRRVSDWADPIPFAVERKKYLMKNYTVQELRDVVVKYKLTVPSNATKQQLVDAIVDAEVHKQCEV